MSRDEQIESVLKDINALEQVMQVLYNSLAFYADGGVDEGLMANQALSYVELTLGAALDEQINSRH